jgi:hypothetical protein
MAIKSQIVCLQKSQFKLASGRNIEILIHHLPLERYRFRRKSSASTFLIANPSMGLQNADCRFEFCTSLFGLGGSKRQKVRVRLDRTQYFWVTVAQKFKE